MADFFNSENYALKTIYKDKDLMLYAEYALCCGCLFLSGAGCSFSDFFGFSYCGSFVKGFGKARLYACGLIFVN